MTRKQVKRLLALLKAQSEYINRQFNFEMPEGFKESFEVQDAFRGWINYHVTWDVDKEDVWKVIHRKMSLVSEWHRELIKVVPIITSDGTIMEAEEWDKRSTSTK